MAITLASEGEETDKLKAIVAKTGSMIRVMPQVIPQDMRSVMADMEVVEAKEKVAKEKADPEGKNNKTETIADDKVPLNIEKEATDSVNKSGKIKRRGKKKSQGEEEVKVDQKGGNTGRTMTSQEATDTAIVKRMVGQLMKDCEATTMIEIDLAEVEQIVERLGRGEEVGPVFFVFCSTSLIFHRWVSQVTGL